MNNAIAIDVVCVQGQHTRQCSEIFVKFISIAHSVDAYDLERAGMIHQSIGSTEEDSHTSHHHGHVNGLGNVGNVGNDGDNVEAYNGTAASNGNNSSNSSNGSTAMSTLSVHEIAQQHAYFERYIQWVSVYCNGQLCGTLNAFIGPENRLYFYDTFTKAYRTQPSSQALQDMHLIQGRNVIVVKHAASNTVIDFEMWLYHANDRLVVMDIDGTITKSDVRGYIETVYRGIYAYVHEGLHDFTQFIEQSQGLHIVYLTARPIVHIAETRLLIASIKEPKKSGPARTGTSSSIARGQPPLQTGPIFTNRAQLLKAAYGELIARTTVKFKSSTILSIIDAFWRAGATGNPFVLGVGNRPTDAKAYRIAGIEPSHILMINSWSKLGVLSENSRPILGLASGTATDESAEASKETLTESENVSDSVQGSPSSNSGSVRPSSMSLTNFVSGFMTRPSRSRAAAPLRTSAPTAKSTSAVPPLPATTSTLSSTPRRASQSQRLLRVTESEPENRIRSRTPPPSKPAAMAAVPITRASSTPESDLHTREPQRVANNAESDAGRYIEAKHELTRLSDEFDGLHLQLPVVETFDRLLQADSSLPTTPTGARAEDGLEDGLREEIDAIFHEDDDIERNSKTDADEDHADATYLGEGKDALGGASLLPSITHPTTLTAFSMTRGYQTKPINSALAAKKFNSYADPNLHAYIESLGIENNILPSSSNPRLGMVNHIHISGADGSVTINNIKVTDDGTASEISSVVGEECSSSEDRTGYNASASESVVVPESVTRIDPISTISFREDHFHPADGRILAEPVNVLVFE